MKAYFLRRLLLVPLTLLGVTLIVFCVSRFVPGGPIDVALQQATQGDGKSKSTGQGAGFDESQMELMEEEFGYDKAIPVAYLQWLGAWKKEKLISKGEFRPVERLEEGLINDPQLETLVVLAGTGEQVLVRRASANSTEVVSANYLGTDKSVMDNGWEVRIESPSDRMSRYARRLRVSTTTNAEGEVVLADSRYSRAPYAYRAVVYQGRFQGVLQGDLGRSSSYNDEVIDLIMERIPIALYFGILTAIITYGVCLPLGVIKALKHRTMIDNVTSIFIFVGYSVPGFALGAVLLVYFGARMGVFPLAGLVSADFHELGMMDQFKDLAMHTVLPLIAYVTGGFAVTTMMMKNNLMDNLAADYVRTAVSKGVRFRTAVFRHAFRNSFIPIATGLGGLISIMVSGSMLIEQVFDIPGFGLLQFQALKEVDIPVIMGTLTIAAFLMLIGNILSDIIVAMIDPRIKFH